MNYLLEMLAELVETLTLVVIKQKIPTLLSTLDFVHINKFDRACSSSFLTGWEVPPLSYATAHLSII